MSNFFLPYYTAHKKGLQYTPVSYALLLSVRPAPLLSSGLLPVGRPRPSLTYRTLEVLVKRENRQMSIFFAYRDYLGSTSNETTSPTIPTIVIIVGYRLCPTYVV